MSRRWHTIALLAVAALIALVSARWALGDRFSMPALIALLHDLGGSVWAVPVFLALYLVASSLMLPSIALFAVAGATWGFAPAVLISWVAANLGANLQFAVARRLGQARVSAWLANRGLGRLTRELETAGTLTVIMIRQVPIPFGAVNLACGASPLRWRDFVVGNAIGVLSNCVVYTWFAASIANGAAGAEREALVTALGIGAVIIVLMLVLRVLGARYLARRAAQTR